MHRWVAWVWGVGVGMGVDVGAGVSCLCASDILRRQGFPTWVTIWYAYNIDKDEGFTLSIKPLKSQIDTHALLD